jgi:rhodanese-related sulfurtransferase
MTTILILPSYPPRWQNSPMTVEELLARARERLDRVDVHDVADATRRGAVLVDIRSELQRERDGTIPGAVFIARNVLEWRCDPASPWRDERVCDPDKRLILVCDEGCQSSLAAATLQELGLPLATDLIGGFDSWRAAGLPVERSESGAGTGREHTPAEGRHGRDAAPFFPSRARVS